MILIKVETQDIDTCEECKFSYNKSTVKRFGSKLTCDLTNKAACITKIAKSCPLLSRHDLLAKAKELYHQEKLEREINEQS
jgi:hypothetical protein